MAKRWVIYNEKSGDVRIVVDKSQVATILGVHVNTISNNMGKLPYKKGDYTVHIAPLGVEKSFRGR
jgi:hypothetical protein